MTTYFIYKRNGELLPTLYAVTDKKYLNESFMEERDDKLFISLKKELSKDEFNQFLKNHSKYLLGIRRYETKPTDSNSLSNSEYVGIVSTDYEEMDTYMKLDDVYTILSKYTNNISSSFNPEILEALNTLEYFTIYKHFHVTDEFVAGVLDFKSSNFSLKPDSLSVFLSIYGYTFKNNNKESET